MKVYETEQRTTRRTAVVTVGDLLDLAKRCREIPRWAPERFEVRRPPSSGVPVALVALGLDTPIATIDWVEVSGDPRPGVDVADVPQPATDPEQAP